MAILSQSHEPIINTTPAKYGDTNFTASCTCGWHDPYLWGAVEGARDAYETHILETLCPWLVER